MTRPAGRVTAPVPLTRRCLVATEPEYSLGDVIRLVCGEDGRATIDLYAVWEAPTS